MDFSSARTHLRGDVNASGCTLESGKYQAIRAAEASSPWRTGTGSALTPGCTFGPANPGRDLEYFGVRDCAHHDAARALELSSVADQPNSVPRPWRGDGGSSPVKRPRLVPRRSPFRPAGELRSAHDRAAPMRNLGSCCGMSHLSLDPVARKLVLNFRGGAHRQSNVEQSAREDVYSAPPSKQAKGNPMSKGMDKKKETKKKPAKTFGEKRAAKREKRQSRGR